MVTFEIDAQGRELDNLLEDFRDNLNRVNAHGFSNSQANLHYCKELSQQVNTVCQAYMLEIKDLEDDDLKKKYMEALKEKDGIYKSLINELELKQYEIDREQIKKEAEESEDINSEPLTAQEVIIEGDRTQDKAQEAIDRMKRITVETEQVGLSTSLRLAAQTEQLESITQGYGTVQHNLTKADVTAKALLNSAASDRCIQILLVGIAVCIVIIIVLISTSSK